jgi:hypothetical protein
MRSDVYIQGMLLYLTEMKGDMNGYAMSLKNLTAQENNIYLWESCEASKYTENRMTRLCVSKSEIWGETVWPS